MILSLLHLSFVLILFPNNDTGTKIENRPTDRDVDGVRNRCVTRLRRQGSEGARHVCTQWRRPWGLQQQEQIWCTSLRSKT
jgi:hypothetical protein